jgi:hypothetical protein
MITLPRMFLVAPADGLDQRDLAAEEALLVGVEIATSEPSGRSSPSRRRFSPPARRTRRAAARVRDRLADVGDLDASTEDELLLVVPLVTLHFDGGLGSPGNESADAGVTAMPARKPTTR